MSHRHIWVFEWKSEHGWLAMDEAFKDLKDAHYEMAHLEKRCPQIKFRVVKYVPVIKKKGK